MSKGMRARKPWPPPMSSGATSRAAARPSGVASAAGASAGTGGGAVAASASASVARPLSKRSNPPGGRGSTSMSGS
jgi:hypothetical protein